MHKITSDRNYILCSPEKVFPKSEDFGNSSESVIKQTDIIYLLLYDGLYNTITSIVQIHILLFLQCMVFTQSQLASMSQIFHKNSFLQTIIKIKKNTVVFVAGDYCISKNLLLPLLEILEIFFW